MDRYYVIKFPLSWRFTAVRARVCLVVTWVYGAVFSSIPLLDVGLGTYVPEGYLTSCSYDYLTDSKKAKIFILVFFVAAWVIPFVLITFCYVSILRVVIFQRNLQNTTTDSVVHVKEKDKQKQEIRLALVVFLVIGLWFAAWTPYAIVSLLGIANRLDLITPLSSMIPALFCKTASCMDPYIYAVTHSRFKAEIKALFQSRKTREANKTWSTCTTRTSWKNPYEESQIEMITCAEISDLSTRIPKRNSRNSSIEKKRASLKVLEDDDLVRNNTRYKVSWWFKPTFSNKPSKFRKLARSLSKKRHENEEAHDDVEFDAKYI